MLFNVGRPACLQAQASPVHQAKNFLIDQGLPADLVIDFGPSFCPQYLNYAAQNGAQHALAIDHFLPEQFADLLEWAKNEFAAGVDYHKADFSKDTIVPWVRNYRKKYAGKCLGIMFDTLLHQYAPLQVTRNLLSVLDCVCLGMPVLKKSGASCVFLPAVPVSEQEAMFPKSWMSDGEYGVEGKLRFSSPSAYAAPGNWLWGISADLLRIWVQRDGFQIIAEKRWEQSAVWDWWGCYAVRS